MQNNSKVARVALSKSKIMFWRYGFGSSLLYDLEVWLLVKIDIEKFHHVVITKIFKQGD